MLLRLRGVVVSDGVKRRHKSRQVSVEKMSASESSMTRRNGLQTLSKEVLVGNALISADDTCLRAARQPAYRWHELNTGSDMERGNLAWDAKRNPQVAQSTRENIDAHDRGGVVCSSDETAVMAVERRHHVIQSENGSQLIRSGGAS